MAKLESLDPLFLYLRVLKCKLQVQRPLSECGHALGWTYQACTTYGTNDVCKKLGLSAQSNLNAEIQIRIRMINGAGHQFDLNAPSSTDSASVTAARAELLRLAQTWLAQP